MTALTNCQLRIINYLIAKLKFWQFGDRPKAVLGRREYVKVMNTFYRAVDSSDRSFEIIKTGWLLFVVSGDL